MNQPPSGGNGGWPPGPKGPPPGGGQGWPAGPGGAPPSGGGYGPPPGGGGYGNPAPPAYGAPPPAYGAPPPAYGAPPPQYGGGQMGGQPGWPSPGGMQPMPMGGYPGHVDDATMKAAAADPQNVFLAELLGAGFLWLPGIGHLMIGDVGMGLAWLIGYPLVVGTFWALIITFTCGIGGLLVFVQIPINFLVGYLLGERVKRRVLEAKMRTGRP